MLAIPGAARLHRGDPGTRRLLAPAPERGVRAMPEQQATLKRGHNNDLEVKSAGRSLWALDPCHAAWDLATLAGSPLA